MPRTITAQQFKLPHGNHDIPGERVLKDFRFDPARCKIEVNEIGGLSITQGDRPAFHAAPGMWKEV